MNWSNYDYVWWQGEPREPALEQAEDIFKALDVNGDGSLDEEEFVK